MKFALTAEQRALQDSVRGFLADRSPIEHVRRTTESSPGYDTVVWAQLADQLGVHAITIPEEYGGVGFGQVELTVVLEEMGRALLPAPFFGTVVLAANALLTSGDRDAMRDYLPAIASGECIATLAWTEDATDPGFGAVTTRAERSGSDWQLTGAKNHVLDGHIAELVLVVANTDSGLALFAVDGEEDGMIRKQLPTVDTTRPLARLEFTKCRARLVGIAGQAGAGLAATLDLAAVGLAAEQVGGARRCLEMAVEYAKNRQQFGKPIGSFQAIKHKCADVLLEVESAWAAAYYAAWAADKSRSELSAAADIAQAYCSTAYTRAAAENVQIHGGIGFTWEHAAHLYLKRAKSSEFLLGTPRDHRERLARRIGLDY